MNKSTKWLWFSQPTSTMGRRGFASHSPTRNSRTVEFLPTAFRVNLYQNLCTARPRNTPGVNTERACLADHIILWFSPYPVLLLCFPNYVNCTRSCHNWQFYTVTASAAAIPIFSMAVLNQLPFLVPSIPLFWWRAVRFASSLTKQKGAQLS